jgi:dTDP-4-dehydrorhamnose reductase
MAKKIRILVLGATGMAGHVISLYLQENGYEVTTFSTSDFTYCTNIIGDATDKALVENLILKGNYDVIINCIGVLNKECDLNKSRAVYLNSFLPHLLADILENTTSKLIHISTDCVFSGKAGPYNENSFRDGESFYDRTKALGEVEDYKNLTFRNSLIGPDMKEDGIGLFNWFMKQDGQINGFIKVLWTGVTTLELAKAIEATIQNNLTGIYHLVNNQSISKYDLLVLFNKYFKDGKADILVSDGINLNKSLKNNRNDFKFEVPSYEAMIIEMREWVYTHKELYSHYFR